MDSQSFPCCLQNRYRLVPLNKGEVREEIIEGGASFEVVKEIFDGDTRACEAKRSAHELRVSAD